MVGNEGITGTPASQFVNDGVFEKTGGVGVSHVTTNFINSGAPLNVLSGSIEFSGGFTNNGVISMAWSPKAAASPPSAPPFPKTSTPTPCPTSCGRTRAVRAAIWTMNGSTPDEQWDREPQSRAELDRGGDLCGLHMATGMPTSSGRTCRRPGFGLEMNGDTLIGGGTVKLSQSGAELWKAIGSGDFNGDGLSDILFFRNTTSGQASVWEMSGNHLIGGVGGQP